MPRAEVAAPRLAGPGAALGVGLVTVGAAGYVFLAVAGRTLDDREYAAVAMLYLLVSVVGPGLFTALEQETSRSVAARLAAGGSPAPAARSALVVGAGLWAALAVGVLAASPVLVDRLFDGRVALLGALLLGAAGAAAAHGVRGVLAGQRRFGGYAVSLVGEGLGRLLPTGVLVAVGLASAAALGWAFAAGTVVAALVALPWLRSSPRVVRSPGRVVRTGTPCPPERDAVSARTDMRGMARGTALLVAATLLAQALANLGPVVVGLRSADDVVVGAFASAVVLARVPLFLVSPVQAVLLPGLTAAASTGDVPAVVRRMRQVLAVVGALGAAGVLGAALLGPWAVQAFFGAGTRPSATVLALLALSTVLFMTAQVLQPALVALGAHRAVAVAWVAGAVVFLGFAVAPAAPVTAAVLAQVLGPAAVVLGMAAVLARAVHR